MFGWPWGLCCLAALTTCAQILTVLWFDAVAQLIYVTKEKRTFSCRKVAALM